MPRSSILDPRSSTILLCGLLLILFAALAWTAAATKSPTTDEPYHAPAGWLHLWRHDFRFDTEDPPLWQFWAALPNGPDALQFDFQSVDWSQLPLNNGEEVAWQIRTLFRTSGNDAEKFIRRSRAMMLIIGVALGGLIAAWSWRLARVANVTAPAAAIISCVLFCLDPNFLAHAPLVKNDVACALSMLALMAAVWAAGRRLSLVTIIVLGLCCGAALTTKFTGIPIVLIAVVVLVVRSSLPTPWMALGQNRKTLVTRASLTAITVALAAAIAWVFIWCCYDFRFAPASEPYSAMNLQPLVQRTMERQSQTQNDAPLPVSAVEFANRHHLLPQAWLAGVLFTYQSALVRNGFLCGRLSSLGWWWYFPFAMLVKTPLATLAVALFAAIAFIARRWRQTNFEFIWAAVCVGFPIAIYLAIAMASHLNLGLRHVLPVYPFLFIVISLAIARLFRSRPGFAVVICSLLTIGLLSETLAAYPNYIAFFNTAAGGSRGGLRLLSDSNLDWGQDLKLLADWQRQHPQEKLYLCYFGSADPAYFGVDYTNLIGGYVLGPAPQPIDAPGVIAISASELQGTYAKLPNGQPYYSWLYSLRPRDVLGGSIYLFQFPPQPRDFLPPGQKLINIVTAASAQSP